MHTRYSVYQVGLNGSRNVCTILSQILERLENESGNCFFKGVLFFVSKLYIYRYVPVQEIIIIFVFKNTPEIGIKVFEKGQQLFAAAQSRGVHIRHRH